MQCEHCGHHGDWLGDGSHWTSVTGSTAARGLYECGVCGHRQRSR